MEDNMLPWQTFLDKITDDASQCDWFEVFLCAKDNEDRVATCWKENLVEYDV
jgi:hypothetical protein